MPRGKRTIRAAEIGSFIYCQRAWWYQRKKIKPLNPDELADGSEFHGEHWLQTSSANSLRAAAWFILTAGLVILAVYFGLQAGGG
ncbi:MAG: hypothetical protein HPY72_09445 [Anaerolineae bacterium]|jgi:hypothetical protein|nr:hypothetical protein [Anaerolineae bacterium]